LLATHSPQRFVERKKGRKGTGGKDRNGRDRGAISGIGTVHLAVSRNLAKEKKERRKRGDGQEASFKRPVYPSSVLSVLDQPHEKKKKRRAQPS